MKNMYNLVEWYFERTKYPIPNKKGNYFSENLNPNFVYIIGNPSNKTFKIGISENFQDRIRNLITSSGCPLFQLLIIELHSEYDEDAKHVEKLLHEYFKEKRQLGNGLN